MRTELKKIRRLAKARLSASAQPLYVLRPAAAPARGFSAGALTHLIRELSVQTLIASEPSTFHSGARSADEPRILVLGNCQAPNLARHIASGCAASVLGLEMLNYHKHRRAFDILCDDADIIITHRLSELFGSISTARLKERYSSSKKIYTHTAIHFSGDHPDLVYLGTMGKRVQSPIGDYHSRIALQSFIAGLDEASCLAAFNEQTFAKLGYFEAAEESFREWERREEDADLRSCAFAREIWRDEQLMMTVNHPRGRLLKHVSDEFLRAEGLPVRDYDHELTPNLLVNGPIWPVHPVLMQHHGKTHPTPSLMWNRGRALSHDDFVRDSYAIYRRIGRDALLGAATDYQRTHVLGLNEPG
ncbi:WcbI family polysaccharide biosynthesis putative acetyltransferase [Ancylobacter sp. A5.8]|uniref:WcbI family polysaccharide biosynthesis putative acetyltransferase n=1 Tax=Ancylobacter gelatini TaxID=2919920 RepID=UPI001F4E5904|nr:WcbI family polysaccharide biosynthesis putative acetyltransferase [Ancylobacter gelatini]MCJ8143798.1 WcbI family polysaccharide biosynthesis putative acetyltransferase [Ancylobacter gelatini]